jgi:hypothetical protein
MIKKIWSDNDSVHVSLWKQLLYSGCSRAACALLEDVFDWVVTDEKRDAWESDLQKKLREIIKQAMVNVKTPVSRDLERLREKPREEKQYRREEISRIKASEDAMVMLGDKDGKKLLEFAKLYAADLMTFRDRVLNWYEHCLYEVDEFGLFVD